MTGAEVSTFAGPTGGSWLARNSYNPPNFTNVDFRLMRRFSFSEKYGLILMADAFNLFNSQIVGGVNTTAYTYSPCPTHPVNGGCLVPSASFGSTTTTSGALYGARQLQFGARFEF